jgi:hypothetical protein
MSRRCAPPSADVTAIQNSAASSSQIVEINEDWWESQLLTGSHQASLFAEEQIYDGFPGAVAAVAQSHRRFR